MFIVQNIQNCHSAKCYKYFVYNIMDHLYLYKTHLKKERGVSLSLFLLLLSFLRFDPLFGEMLKILISA